MIQLIVTDREGNKRTLEVNTGYSLMDTLRDHGFDQLEAICGGCCSCGTCHVYLLNPEGRVDTAVADDEDSLLDISSFRKPESRLSCQILVTEALDQLEVVIAPED